MTKWTQVILILSNKNKEIWDVKFISFPIVTHESLYIYFSSRVSNPLFAGTGCSTWKPSASIRKMGILERIAEIESEVG